MFITLKFLFFIEICNMIVHLEKTLLLLTLMFLFLRFGRKQEREVRWILTGYSSVKVNGSTNINKFSCSIPTYSRTDTLSIKQAEPGSRVLKMSGTMRLRIDAFDCHQAMMTADLRKTLKYKEFPELLIRFISMDSYPGYRNEGTVNGQVAIELAGKAKRFDVAYKYLPSANGNLVLTGRKQVRFSDFEIIAPRKLGGMIKTDDVLDVEFTVSVKILK